MKVYWKGLWPYTSIKDASIRTKNRGWVHTKQDMYYEAIKYLNDWSGGYIPPSQLHKQKVIIRYMEWYYPELCI